MAAQFKMKHGWSIAWVFYISLVFSSAAFASHVVVKETKEEAKSQKHKKHVRKIAAVPNDIPEVVKPTEPPQPPSGQMSEAERLMTLSLEQIHDGQAQTALKTLDTLLNIAPNFKLAHLVKGDLLMAQAHNLRGFGGVASPASRAAIDDFLQEARVRYNRAQHITDLNRFAEPVWKLDNNTPYVMVVDVRASRLFLYQNAQGGLRHISDYYVTVGKNGSEKHTEGDKRTPIGVYFTGTQLPNKKLPSLYGAAAFPLNYPNEIDRHEGKDGHGIWLHGTPSDTYSRPPNASDGCVVLTNQDLLSLAPILQAGRTPIVIVEHALPETNADSEKSELLRAIEQWRVGLESQKQDMLNDAYATDFFGKSTVRMQMASQTPVTVALSNINLFRYPNPTKKMVLVDFDQEIQYKTTRKLMHRRQYWVFDNSRWKILYEGAA